MKRAVLADGRSWCCRAFLRRANTHLVCDECGAVNGSAAFACEDDALMSEHFNVPLMGIEEPMSEQQIQNEILRAFATRPDMRLWRANSGAARFGDRTVKFGVNGQADLTGILPGGRRLEIEVKAEKGRQSTAQKNYQAMIERFGGVYVLARSVEDVRVALGVYLEGGGA